MSGSSTPSAECDSGFSFLLECKDLEALDVERVELLAEQQKAEAKAAKRPPRLIKPWKATLGRYEAIEKDTLSRPVPNTHDGRLREFKAKKKKGEMEYRWLDGKQIKVGRGPRKFLLKVGTVGKGGVERRLLGRVIRKSQGYTRGDDQPMANSSSWPNFLHFTLGKTSGLDSPWTQISNFISILHSKCTSFARSPSIIPDLAISPVLPLLGFCGSAAPASFRDGLLGSNMMVLRSDA